MEKEIFFSDIKYKKEITVVIKNMILIMFPFYSVLVFILELINIQLPFIYEDFCCLQLNWNLIFDTFKSLKINKCHSV